MLCKIVNGQARSMVSYETLLAPVLPNSQGTFSRHVQRGGAARIYRYPVKSRRRPHHRLMTTPPSQGVRTATLVAPRTPPSRNLTKMRELAGSKGVSLPLPVTNTLKKRS